MWVIKCTDRPLAHTRYVVDAADVSVSSLSASQSNADDQTKSLPTATAELQALLALPALASVPLLVLANKNDLPGALGVDDLIKQMQLDDIRGRAVSVSPNSSASGRMRDPGGMTERLTAVLFHKQQDQAQPRHCSCLAYAARTLVTYSPCPLHSRHLL